MVRSTCSSSSSSSSSILYLYILDSHLSTKRLISTVSHLRWMYTIRQTAKLKKLKQQSALSYIKLSDFTVLPPFKFYPMPHWGTIVPLGYYGSFASDC